MPGPPKKHDERRQRRNGRGTGGITLPPPKTLAQVPAPGKHWLVPTKQQWVAFWLSSVACLVEADSDGFALARLFSLYDERERAYRAYRRNRLVEGSTGQMIVNPLWKQAAVNDAEIRALEDRFGVTPSARLKLGIKFGEAARNIKDLNDQLNADEDNDSDEAKTDPRLKLVVRR